MQRRRIFDIEVTNKCNIACIFCPRDKMYVKGDMTPDIFQKILKNVSFHKEDVVTFCGMGEPFMNKNLVDFFTLIHNKYPSIIINVVTNATLLTEELTEKLLPFNISLNVSFFGVEKSEYEKFMQCSKFDKTLTNIVNCADKFKPYDNLNLKVSHLVYKENFKSIEKVRSFWNSRGIESFIRILHNRGNTIDLYGMTCLDIEKFNNYCYNYNNITYISFNGDILPCCHDINHNYVIGNITKHNYSKIKDLKTNYVKKIWPAICYKCKDVIKNKESDYTL